MKKLLPLLVAVVSLGFASCKKESVDSPVQIRVQNLSAFNIEAVTIVSESKHDANQRQYNYGNLNAQQISSYLDQGVVYDLPTCTFTVNGKPHQFIPRCQVGLKELTSGRYTLKITADDSGNINYPEFTKD